MYLNQNIK